jgi:hypothetical protein
MIKRRFALLSALGLLFFACKQSPIFYEISLEVEPVDPRIEGSPTNIVQKGDLLYVASKFGGAIYKYENSEWSVLPQAPGEIIELAATNDALYALTGSPGSLSLKFLSDNTQPQEWSTINTTGYNIQSIYGAEDYLFAGSRNPTSTSICSILYVKDGKLELLKSETSLLKGAVYAGNTYYLATNGSGILTVNDPSSGTLQAAEVSGHNDIMGIIQVVDKIVAVSRDGYILYSNDGAFTAVKASNVTYFTGALATWKSKPADTTPSLLLLGIQGGSVSTVHGYREIVLNDDGTISNISLNSPGENTPSSVSGGDDQYNQYVVTIGKQPLSSIIQAPDGILFAATAKDGLWSYKERNGKSVWNAED